VLSKNNKKYHGDKYFFVTSDDVFMPLSLLINCETNSVVYALYMYIYSLIKITIMIYRYVLPLPRKYVLDRPDCSREQYRCRQ